MVRGERWAAVAVLVLRVAAPAAAADGARVYADRCSGCHGDDGRGDGPAAAAVIPKPRDLRGPDLWAGKTDVALRDVVRRGKPGTMMPPFEGTLSDAEIDAVVTFIRRFDPATARPPPATSGRPQ
jgi:mono/diheme cytochrome c family protein